MSQQLNDCLVKAAALPLSAEEVAGAPTSGPVPVQEYRLGRPERNPAPHYPGERPDSSFVVLNGTVFPMRPAGAGSRWEVLSDDGWTDADVWLAARGQAPLRNRLAVLAYGSNLNPREVSAVGGERAIVVLRGALFGAAAAYCQTRRGRDLQHPAGLIAHESATGEWHGVLLVESETKHELDNKEGAGRGYYDLVHLPIGAGVELVLEDGRRWSGPLPTYRHGVHRPIAVRDGAPLLVREHTQEQVQAFDDLGLTHDLDVPGVPAGALAPLATAPMPVFAYGTLQPGECRWLPIEHLVASTAPGQVAGRRIDTGFGFPGLVDLGSEVTDGTVLTPHDHAYDEFLELLDSIEGHPRLYTRTLVRLLSGELAWVYAWNGV